MRIESNLALSIKYSLTQCHALQSPCNILHNACCCVLVDYGTEIDRNMVKPTKNWRVTRKRRVSVEVFVAFKSACLVLLPTHNLLGRKLLCAHTLDCVSNGVRLNTESIVRS